MAKSRAPLGLHFPLYVVAHKNQFEKEGLNFRTVAQFRTNELGEFVPLFEDEQLAAQLASKIPAGATVVEVTTGAALRKLLKPKKLAGCKYVGIDIAQKKSGAFNGRFEAIEEIIAALPPDPRVN